MKVGMVSTAQVKCGISTYSFYLSEALQKSGIDVTILGEHPYPDERALDGDFLIDVPIKLCWKRTEPYTELIEESKKYDVMHIQHQFGLFPSEANTVELYKKIKKPLVTTLHDIIQPNFQAENYFKAIIENSDKIIVHTPTCKNLLLLWGCPAEKIELIYHGTKLIEVPEKKEARKRLGLPENAKIILSWGFIWESKGLVDLVKILSEVKKTYPEAMFVHAGGVHPIIQGSTYLKNILKIAVKSGLTPKDLKITDWVPENEVPAWFGSSDVIVLNYMRGSASASGAAHRALASHRPICKTDDPCLEEIPGYIVPRFDINSLCNGVLKVLSDEKLQAELIKKQDVFAQETSWQNTALKHQQVYFILFSR